jgi:hypothetical protein
MKLTEKQIIAIVDNKLISSCNDEAKKQVFAFMFGEEYIASNDKGQIKEYSS